MSFWGEGGYKGIILSVCPSVHMSCKRNSLTDKPILMKLYTDVVYDTRMCMKEDNHGPKPIKGDNSRKIIVCI